MTGPARPPGAPARLQKILSEAGVASRREAETWIREGRVTVNGRVAALGERADPGSDAIKIDGKRLKPPAARRRYLLLNKPRGFVTTVSDPEGRDTVLHLLPENIRRGIRPVGRLDVQTEGLLLLTDDGDLARQVAHPSGGFPKEYRVKVSGVPEEKDLERLRRGIFLDGERTRPCEIERISTTGGRERGNSWLRVTLREGKSRQIRRMFETTGHPVSKLRRVAIGPLRDRGLPPGTWRWLESWEVEALRSGQPRRSAAAEAPKLRRRRRRH
ncbi:MAG TPA: pseudouridine synthase [Thermoanaerobaculia bacterium]|jgi:pseudouridine synthase